MVRGLLVLRNRLQIFQVALAGVGIDLNVAYFLDSKRAIALRWPCQSDCNIDMLLLQVDKMRFSGDIQY
ncbi:hypothetical protein D9M72_596840 [compost metagenome]